MERYVAVTPNARLWVEELGDTGASPLLLVMGANASGMVWPEELVERLARRHRVIRYDHRDTGRSTRAFAEEPYAVRDLAGDAVAVLDALGIGRAHVAGMSMGGVLVQLLCLDHPDRLLSATAMNTAALGAGLAAGDAQGPELPGPDPALLKMWESMADPRGREAEIEWRVEHWRLLNGTRLPFDAAAFREMEERVIAHSGTHRSPAAHMYAAQDGLERGSELETVATPFLVIDAPEDPVNPPPHSAHLASAVPGARMVTVPGMGHALCPAAVPMVADAVLSHTAG